MMNDKILYRKKQEIHQGNLILVNADFPLHSGKREQKKVPEYIPVNEDYPKILMEYRAAQIMKNLLKEISGEEMIVPVSGYRSAKEQTEIYENSEKENGKEFTAKYVALPFCSEHQTGLAMDLGLKKDEIDFICPDFPYEGICQTFREHASAYGFIERYQKGKEEITGISAEPWHFRYVGAPHADIMKEHDFVLEEYISFLRQYTKNNPYLYGKEKEIKIYFVPAEPEGETEIRMSGRNAYDISGNNVDGFIVTIWGEQK